MNTSRCGELGFNIANTLTLKTQDTVHNITTQTHESEVVLTALTTPKTIVATNIKFELTYKTDSVYLLLEFRLKPARHHAWTILL